MNDINFNFGGMVTKEKPDPVECEDCGEMVEAIELDDGKGWIRPTSPCDDCQERIKREEKLEDCKRKASNAFYRAVESERHRKVARSVDFDERLARVFDTLGEMVCGMYIWGEAGTGKTTQLIRSVDEFLKWHFVENLRDRGTAQYVNETGLFSELRSTYDDQNSSAHRVLKKYQQASFLVLDDLGTANASDWVAEQLYLLIDKRYTSLKPTLFASNASLGKLSNHPAYDDRIISRIFEMCGLSITDDGAVRGDNYLKYTTNFRKGGTP